jgi:hypothetical protein
MDFVFVAHWYASTKAKETQSDPASIVGPVGLHCYLAYIICVFVMLCLFDEAMIKPAGKGDACYELAMAFAQ